MLRMLFMNGPGHSLIYFESWLYNVILGPSGSSNNALSNFPLAPEAKYEVFHDLLNDLLRPSSHMSTVMYDISTAVEESFDDQVGWQTL